MVICTRGDWNEIVTFGDGNRVVDNYFVHHNKL